MLMLVTLDDISVTKRPLTVGLQVFASVDQGVDWSVHMRCCIDDFGAANARFPTFSAGFYSKLSARWHPLSSQVFPILKI